MPEKRQPTHKQHIVPQLYLRPFANENGRLIAYDKTDGRIFPVRIQDAAQKHGFFSIPEVDGESGAGWFAEAYFRLYETPAAAAIRTVLNGVRIGIFACISDEVRWTLSKFIAVQHQRTQVARGRIADMNRAFNIVADRWPEAAQMREELHILNPAELAEYHLKYGLSPEKVENLAEVLFGHVWGIMINRTPTRCYTSDHPVTLHCHKDRPGRGTGLGTFGVEVSLPIAPHCLLVLVERRFVEKFLPPYLNLDGRVWDSLAEENATFYRSLQVRDYHRFVYSNRLDDFDWLPKCAPPIPNSVTQIDRE